MPESLCALIASTFPALDEPLVGYVQSMLEDNLKSIKSVSDLDEQLTDMLIEHEAVNNEAEAKAKYAKFLEQLQSNGYIKLAVTKPAPASTAKQIGSQQIKLSKQPNGQSAKPVTQPTKVTAQKQTKGQSKPAAQTTPSDKVDKTTSAMSKLSLSSTPAVADSKPSADLVGCECDALFEEDGRFYPAQIVSVRDDEIEVLYTEYGNRAWVDQDDVINIQPNKTAINSSEPRALTQAVRIGDRDEREKADRQRARQDRKDRDAAYEAERAAREIKISKKKMAERVRLAEEEKKRRTYDESARKLERERALGIHLDAVAHLQKAKNVKVERDLHLEDLTLLAPDNGVLLTNTSLKLVHGRRYALIGRNGLGKSTLLRHMSSYTMEGVPHYLRIAHVEQEAAGDDGTVIETVLAADAERKMLIEEEQALLAGRASAPTEAAPVEAAPVAPGNEDRLSEIYSRLDAIDSWTAEARAASICAGLGFTPDMLQMPTRDLSGGWRMRVSLASALLLNPDLLLLDEPTNHLDFVSVLFLTQYLTETFKNTLLIVSHDRTFLNDVATDCISFTNNQTLEQFRGDYDSFLAQKNAKYIEAKRAYEAQQMKIEHIQEFITTYYTEKKSSKQAAKIGQVESRKKVLETMERIPDPDTETSIISTSFALSFPEPEPLRLAQIAHTRDVNFAYPSSKSGTTQTEGLLLKDVNVRIEVGSRIGLLGKNGAGKSTLLKLLTGALTPTDGNVWLNPAVSVAFFTQHHVDTIDLGITPIECLQAAFPGTEEVTCRSHLARFGLGGDWSLLQCGQLSGGQKSRLAFAIMTWRSPHLIILDEPTNHLDMQTIDALIQALSDYKGSVICVSHDQFFLERTAKEFWAVGNSTVKILHSLADCKRYAYTL